MKIWRRGIQAKLHAQLVAALEARAQVIFDMDLHCPLPQELEQLLAQFANLSLGVDRSWAEVDLGVAGQQRLKESEDGLVDRVDEVDHEH